MTKYWIIPRVGDKELPRIGHQLASCSILISYILISEAWIRAQIPVCVCCVASVCRLTWGHCSHTHTLPKQLLFFFYYEYLLIYRCWC